MAGILDFGPIVFVRRMSREEWISHGHDDASLVFNLICGRAVPLLENMTAVIELDDVAELSVKHDGGEAVTELTFATRDVIRDDDLFIVGLQSGKRLLLGWHSVHSGSVVREGESTSPRREGAPVRYTFTQAVDALEVNLLYAPNIHNS